MSNECPICGESLGAPVPLACPVCGAHLANMVPPSPPVPASPPSSAGLSAAQAAAVDSPLAAAETDELLRIFRAQFEQRQLELPAAWSERLSVLASAAEPGRRLATIIFVDLREFTALTQALPEDRLADLLQWFHGVCTRRVALHGGFIIQLLGDAAFAAFGAPAAFERDAESALRALIEIREEVRQRGSFEGHPLAIRAGADMGVVTVKLTDVHGQARIALMGSACNLAARLEEHAETWEILASDTLAEAVRGRFDLEPRAPFRPRNFDREVAPRAVLRHREALAVRRDDAVRLVGRRAEQAELAAFLQGPPAALAVRGEAGLGKTRLINELRASEASRRWMFATCEPHLQHVPLGFMVELLRSAFATQLPPGGSNASTLEERWTQWSAVCAGLTPQLLPTLGYLLHVEPHATALAGLPGAMLRRQLIAGLVGWLGHMLATQWDVLWLDDLHWCDPLSLEVLAELLRRERGAGHLLFSGRPNAPHELATASSWLELPVARRMELPPLDGAAKAELLAQILDIDRLASPTQRALLEQAEGQPLLLIELGRMVAAQAPLPIGTAASAAALPRSLQEILQARIDALDRAQRDLLFHASIIGRRFTTALLSAMLQHREELQGELLALRGLRLIEAVDEVAGEYRFAPTLLRELTYANLTRRQRAQLHRELAQAFEREFATRRGDFVFELAQHWIRAGDLAAARKYLRRAAQQALVVGAVEECRQLLTQAQALQGEPAGEAPPADAPGAALLVAQQRAVLAELAGRAARMAGDYAAAEAQFEQFAQLARQVENSGWQHQAAFQLATTQIEQGLPQRALQALDALLLQTDLDPELALRLQLSRGVARLRLGQLESAEQDFLAVVRAPETMAASAADARNNLGLLGWMRGNYTAAEEHFHEATRIWRRLGLRHGECASTSNRGIIAEQLGQFATARQLYLEALHAAEAMGYLHGISAAEANLANVALLALDHVAARAHAARALHFARLIGHRHSESIALENLGLALVAEDPHEARRHLEAALELGLAMGDPQRSGSARLALAWAALSAGELADCAAQLAQVDVAAAPDLQPWLTQLRQAHEALASFQDRGPLPAFDAAAVAAQPAIPDRLRAFDIWHLLARFIPALEPREQALAELRGQVAHFG